MHHKIKIGMQIRFASKWHTGSGESSLLIDRLIRRDAQGWPFIPGSTLKGVVRESCEKLSRSLNFPEPADPHQTDLTIQDTFHCLDKLESPVDRIFGNRYQSGNLFFRDARLDAQPPYRRHYFITATLLAPLTVQQTRQTNAPQALPYLPGSTFRGAVAAKYLREEGSPEDDAFRSLFVDDPVSFPDLLPADSEGKTISQVLPLTSASCKRHPGFKSQTGHGVTDLLAQKLVARHNSVGNEHRTCHDCESDVKAISGFWNGNINTPAMLQPTMFCQRHTGIDRDTGTAAQKIFFITQAVADFNKTALGNKYEKQLLAGGTFMDNRQLAILEPLLQGTLFAGQDRTRGMGELQIVMEPIDMALPDIENWSKEFKSLLDGIAPANINSDLLTGLYFSLKLESHAILFDEFLRPSYEIELSFPGVEPVLKVAKSQLVRGWNNAWGMAKPNDMGVMMGSVYLYRYSGGDMEGLRSYLARVGTIGIGQRRSEGFGRVLICDSLHIQREAM